MNWTIKSLLDWTTIFFKNHKIEEPHLEAEILLSFALNIKRIQIYTMFEKVLNQEELAAFKKLIIRRIRREPTSYIIGRKSFMSLDFIVDKNVLIPRPETEILVESAIDIIKELNKENTNVLEIGTGSGAIAISIAKYCPNTKIIATDISQKALEIAQKNSEHHKTDGNVQFIAGNIFENLNKDLKFDLILSNPPYIKTAEIQNLQPEIKNFEPLVALDGGQDGLDFYRKISKEAHNYLQQNGYLILECGYEQSKKVIDLIKNSYEYSRIYSKKDLNGIDRVVIAEK